MGVQRLLDVKDSFGFGSHLPNENISNVRVMVKGRMHWKASVYEEDLWIIRCLDRVLNRR